MKITEIVVHAGRTFNNPYENYANFKPSVSFRATVEDGEDVNEATKRLADQAEAFMEDHKASMLADLAMVRERARRAARVSSLEKEIKRMQAELDAEKEDGTPAQIAESQSRCGCNHEEGRHAYDHDEGYGGCLVSGCECDGYAVAESPY